MNEGIKQLMGQALDEKFAGTWSVMDLQDLTKFADRFSELIVRECSWTVRMTEFGDNLTQEQIARHIEDHFGVENERTH